MDPTPLRGLHISRLLSKSNSPSPSNSNTTSKINKSAVNSLIESYNKLNSNEKLYFLVGIGGGAGGVGSDDDAENNVNGTNCNGSGGVSEQATRLTATTNWLHSNFTLDPTTALPKEQVYDFYLKTFNTTRHISTADFGKLMRQVFPDVKARRLGQRGASKYCYANIRRRSEFDLERPALKEVKIDPNVEAGYVNWARGVWPGVEFKGGEAGLEEILGVLKGCGSNGGNKGLLWGVNGPMINGSGGGSGSRKRRASRVGCGSKTGSVGGGQGDGENKESIFEDNIIDREVCGYLTSTNLPPPQSHSSHHRHAPSTSSTPCSSLTSTPQTPTTPPPTLFSQHQNHQQSWPHLRGLLESGGHPSSTKKRHTSNITPQKRPHTNDVEFHPLLSSRSASVPVFLGGDFVSSAGGGVLEDSFNPLLSSVSIGGGVGGGEHPGMNHGGGVVDNDVSINNDEGEEEEESSRGDLFDSVFDLIVADAEFAGRDDDENHAGGVEVEGHHHQGSQLHNNGDNNGGFFSISSKNNDSNGF